MTGEGHVSEQLPIEPLMQNQGEIASILTGVLTLLTFAVIVSERLQKILGPLGRWFRKRKQNAVEDQMNLEDVMRARHEAQISAMQKEINFYRERYEAAIDELEEQHPDRGKEDEP